MWAATLIVRSRCLVRVARINWNLKACRTALRVVTLWSVGQAYRHKRTSVFLINFHFVWCPKRRRKVLTGTVEKDLRRLIQQQAKALECEIVALQIMPDHVHLFLNCHPGLAPNEIMFHIKGSTSKALREKYPQLARMTSLWTRSYFCSTAGNVSSQTVRRYIENQKTR